jgi:hypothetical protein
MAFCLRFFKEESHHNTANEPDPAAFRAYSLKMAKSPEPLRDLFRSRRLGDLLRSAQQQNRLHQTICAGLPEPLRPCCVGSRLHEGLLTLTLSGSAAASSARFLAPQLVLSFQQQNFPELKTLKIKVRPEGAEPPAVRPRPRATPDSTTVQHLAETAAGFEDEGLRNALDRLSRTLKRQRRGT